MVNIEIRDMVLEDYSNVDLLMKEVHELHVDNRPDLYGPLEHPYSLEEFERLVKDEKVISVVAREGEAILGILFITMREKSGMIEKKIAYMEDLCVGSKYRGQGIGKMLFKYGEEQAKSMGAERLDLMVWSFNKNAMEFYKELGMSEQRCILEKPLVKKIE